MSLPPSRTSILVSLAVLYCGLNAFKPIQIDDAAYFYFARQMRHEPLNPYGFRVLWYHAMDPANDILAPPVLPYTWALAMWICGDVPWLCKLLLLPWSLLLMFGLHALFRRFAAGWEVPLTAFTAFSPALLPSLNLMLDVPALALSLCAIHLFLRACDEDDFRRAVLAGLLGGLAFETKYTGIVAPAVMLAGGLLFRRWRLIPAALLTTAQVFVCWELLMALGYDHAHFFNNASGQTLLEPGLGPLDKLTALVQEKIIWLPILFTLLGGVVPALIVLGLAATGLRPRRSLVVVAVLLVLCILAIALDYDQIGGGVQAWVQAFGEPLNCGWFKLSDAIFFVVGIVAFSGVVVVVWQLLWGKAATTEPHLVPPLRSRYQTIFLLLWLQLEIGGYFMMTPFPAVRRVLGVMVVLTLLVGRLVALTCQAPRTRRTVQVILAGGIVLGLAFFALDCWNARAQQTAANDAADWIEAHGDGRVWYTGHWGFQYYAEHRGMKPLYLGSADVAAPTVAAGDWLVVPDDPHNRQAIDINLHQLTEEHVVVVEDAIPLRTVANFYGGTAALEHHEGPRLVVRIYRVVEGFVPVVAPSP